MCAGYSVEEKYQAAPERGPWHYLTMVNLFTADAPKPIVKMSLEYENSQPRATSACTLNDGVRHFQLNEDEENQRWLQNKNVGIKIFS